MLFGRYTTSGRLGSPPKFHIEKPGQAVPEKQHLASMKRDFNAEVVGDCLYRAGKLGIGRAEIVIFHDPIRSAAIWALNGEQLGVGPSWLEALEDKSVGIAIATV